LETLEADYKRLRDHASQPTLESRVDLKLREIEHWREFKREFDDFVKLTAETTERDAKLLALQRQKEAGFDDTESDADDAPIGEPRTITSDAPPPSGSPPVPDGSQIVPPTSNPSPQPPPLPSETQSTSRIPRFDGAGIVQRAATVFPRFPRYVLLAPNGRILAYLEGQPGVNLDLYLGRAMGIIGVRTHRQELQADFISVRRLVPVRLKVAP